MFDNVNKIRSECIGHRILQSQSEQGRAGYAGYIQVPDDQALQGTGSVVIQVYVNPNELPSGTTMDSLAGVPLVSVHESPEAISGAEWGLAGMKLVNYGNYLIDSPTNINQAKIVPFNENVNVYIVFNFYK